MEQAMAIAKNVEKQTGVVCLGIWIHRDEGHARSRFNPDEPYQCNNHIHILWDCQNPTTGKAIPIMKQDLRDMQDIAANALGMERGNPAEQTKKKHIDSGTYKVQQLQAEIKQLKEEKTGLVGKIQDAWKWKGRAKQAEADLEAERTRLTNEINSRDTIIADLKKELQNEKKRADSAERREESAKNEREKYYKDVLLYKSRVSWWEDRYNKLKESLGKEQSQSNGFKR